MRLAFALAAAVTAACSACGGGGDDPDAPPPAVDGRIDGPPPACDGTVQFTGALLDFDSTTTAFLGVAGAQFTLRAMPGCTSTTAPNGRFDMMVPPAMDVIADIDAPTPYLEAIVIAEQEALDGSIVMNLRLFTLARAQSFYTERGVPAYDPGRAHVLVFSPIDRTALSLGAAHDSPQSGNDDDGDGELTWGAGTSGRYVLFPNVDVGAPTTTLTGDLDGPLTIPLEAGKVTLVVEHAIVL